MRDDDDSQDGAGVISPQHVLEKLVREKVLRIVRVQSASQQMRDAATEEVGQLRNRKPLLSMACHSNSICLVRAMRKLGEEGWDLVVGFGIPVGLTSPLRHVWARRHEEHYDVTWPMSSFDPALSNYYHLLSFVPPSLANITDEEGLVTAANTLLWSLAEKAQEWGLRVN